MDKLIRNSTAEFLIFTSQSGENSIEVKVFDESVWLTQAMIAELFDKGRTTITEHLKNIFESEKLDENSFLDEKQKKNKVKNNLQALRKSGKIEPEGRTWHLSKTKKV